MNPFHLSASDLMIWGLVAHLVADWPLQNDWMARNKRWPWRWSAKGLLPPLVHAELHGIALGLVFGWWPGQLLALSHLLIDTGKPVAWWSRFVGQTQPGSDGYDIGLEVRFWTDQVFHVVCIAAAALLVVS